MKKINYFIRLLFFVLIKAIVLIFLGLNIRRRELLPRSGPAIIVANHNSHLDTLVLVSLFPLVKLHKIHPVAAADYFLKSKFMAWFATQIVGIIPIARGKASKSYDPLRACCDALDQGNIIVLFPEGTRGEPERILQFKKGVAYLAERYIHAPITPVFIHGLGKSLPKGDFVLVPFFCDLFVGTPLSFEGDKNALMDVLNHRFLELAGEGHFSEWE